MSMEKTDKYIETIGRRKTSVARVRMTEASKNTIVVNEKEYEVYFPTKALQLVGKEAFGASKTPIKFKITAVIKGGGISSQVQALRHGISRGLVEFDAELRKSLKSSGLLKRDARAKERRKFGLKKARKAPQWSKR
jgi:small subunit ribosomal protein S9